MPTETLSYLAGLIIGRGRLFEEGRVVIEFSHTNKTISGIARCPNCNSVSTKKGEIYRCKHQDCGEAGFIPNQKTYDQIKETQNSINEVIIPYLKSNMSFISQLVKTEAITMLILDFDTADESWLTLKSWFSGNFHYHYGSLPHDIEELSTESKKEFVNGVLDTAGFANSGGWLPRKGKKINIRQRIYLQVVRNWRMTVSLDNFLRKHFQIPIQTIDWGHPNMRDPNLVEAQAGKTSAYAREHQVKIYPEFLEEFKFRISHKNKLFRELLNHNKENEFTNREDWFPPKKIGELKPKHPEELNARMDVEVRKHFDAFWQINLALGCEFLTELSKRAKNREVFALTGDTELNMPLEKLRNELELKRPKVELKQITKTIPATKAQGTIRGKKEMLEFATYPILKTYFDEMYFHSDPSKGEFFITNFSTLSTFVKDQPKEFIRQYEECEEYKIRPDLVGFDKKEIRMIFIESKVDPLNMDMLGQILGYCLVAEPKEAYLLSTETMSPRFVNALSARPDILNYGEKQRIKIGQIVEEKVVLYDF